ncbi:hypothetical protein ACE1SV_30080 [Streptomyces sp. E-15]
MGSSGQESNSVCNPLEHGAIRGMAQHFHRYGIVTVTELIREQTRREVRAEAERLLEKYAERRDLRLKTTGYTRRSMSVVPSETIAGNSELVTSIYANPGLLAALGDIAGEKLHPCPKEDEEFLITRQEQRGDTHGWHWGDFSFALIWILQAPPIDVGGLLQCVPHTEWDKSAPRIHQYLVDNPIDTYYFATGDLYFLRTDTTLHRTIPLNQDATRIILNMTWAGARDLQRELQGDDRWWEDADVSAATALGE